LTAKGGNIILLIEMPTEAIKRLIALNEANAPLIRDLGVQRIIPKPTSQTTWRPGTAGRSARVQQMIPKPTSKTPISAFSSTRRRNRDALSKPTSFWGTKQSEQEILLRLYFAYKPLQVVKFTGIGALLLLLGLIVADYIGAWSPFAGIIITVGSILWLLIGNFAKPSDKKVDLWLQEGINGLIERSLGNLNLDESEAVTEPLVVKGPILWSTFGIADKDLVWKKGKDKIVRFAVYRVTVIWLTEHHLAAFACDYNFMKNVPLNEQAYEYRYKDIVSVATRETASSYTLPTGVKLITTQEFRITVPGDALKVTINILKLSEIAGSDKIPETGAEKAVSVIRAMLREED
jgi:hypothetical protein